MIKRILICILFFACCPAVFAGALFNVSATGSAAPISITLCLDGKGPLSCQNYTTSALNLSIKTTIPNHTYPNAGIKVNTPGYIPGCSRNSNGYCLFSVSDTTAATIPVTSTSCQNQSDLIVFSPTVTQVNNPTGSGTNPSQQFTIYMTMCNSQGQPLLPSATNPVHVNVYGAPNGVISPTATTTSTGAVTFTYNGQSFPNNIMIDAWISDNTNNGAAIGQSQILQQNPLPCSYKPVSYNVPLASGLPNALTLQADVGYAADAPTTTLQQFPVDTGSLGLIVPIAFLPNNANVIGPGPVGYQYYGSSGQTFSGNYYLATVRIKTSTGTVVTPPILILGINNSYCSGPPSKSCWTTGPQPADTFFYMGVGFDRPGAGNPTDLFHSPTANAFLHIMDANNGTDISPGYYLTPNDSSAPSPKGITLGISSTTNYNVVNLTPSSTVPGDFNTEYGCFSFPGSSSPDPFCGTLLLDVGISEMLISLPQAQWPAGVFDPNNNDYVITTTPMTITAGTSNQLNYSFTAVQSCPGATGPNNVAPCYAQLQDSSSTGVNTGRRPLYRWDYFYQGQCGQVGFYNFNP